jgi:hypothetical protein
MDKDKKDSKGKSGGSSGSNTDAVETLVIIFFTLLVISAIFAKLSAVFSIFQSGQYSTGAVGSFFSSFLFPMLKLMAFGLSAVAFIGIIYNILGLTKINVAQNAIYNASDTIGLIVVEEKKNRRWERVIMHLNSTNPNDWKFAILEAEIILDELLDVMGYRGETMSDKLKKIEPSDFSTLDLAWEAHKVRNTIAHEGSDYVMTEREARRVIGLYQSVFEEFNYI